MLVVRGVMTELTHIHNFTWDTLTSADTHTHLSSGRLGSGRRLREELREQLRAATAAALHLPAWAYFPKALMPIAASSSIAFRTVIWKSRSSYVKCDHLNLQRGSRGSCPVSGAGEKGNSAHQDLLSGFMLALYLLSQVSLWDLQVLSHLSTVLEQGQVAILDPDQLIEDNNKKNSEKKRQKTLNELGSLITARLYHLHLSVP